MQRSSQTRTLVFVLPLLVSGCIYPKRTRFTQPQVSLPATWQNREQSTSVDTPWWKAFGDGQLDAVITQALLRNNDALAAAIRVRRAGLEAKLAGIALRPMPTGTINYSGSVGRNNLLRNADTSVGANIELDLFGRLRAQRDVARLEYDAVAEDRLSVQLATAATTMQLYWQLGYANQRIALGSQSIRYAQHTLELIQVRYRAGAVSSIELRDSEQALETQTAAQEQLHRGRTTVRNAFLVLLGGEAFHAPEPQMLPKDQPAAPDPGLPVSLVARRPDLRAREARLRSTLSGTDAIRASFYPALTLSNIFATAGAAFLGNPAGTLSSSLSLPFLDPQRRNLTVAAAQTGYEEATFRFRQNVIQAFREVADGLEAHERLRSGQVHLVRAHDAAVAAESLYEVRFRAGAIPLRMWLDAQERRRTTELSLLENRLQLLLNRIQLDIALGGPTIRSK